MNKLSPDARRLLELARDADDPTPGQRVRADAAVRLGLALHGVNDLPPLPASPSPAAPRLGASASWKLALGAAALLAGGLFGVHGLQSPPARRSAPPPSAAAQTLTPAVMSGTAPALRGGAAFSPDVRADSVPAPAQRALEIAMTARSPHRARSSVQATNGTGPALRGGAAFGGTAPALRGGAAFGGTAPALRGGASMLQVEVQLIGSANGLIRARRFDEALRVLATHARRFPHGELREERDALRVLSLCGAGPRERAQQAVQRFLNSAPRSVVAQRVRAACAEGDGALR